MTLDSPLLNPTANLIANIVMIAANVTLAVMAHPYPFFAVFAAIHAACCGYWIWVIYDDARSAE